ncbi:hypothetical protein [Spongorhabdus nitratireducens]
MFVSLSWAGVPPPNNPVQPLAILQDQDAIQKLLGVDEGAKSIRLTELTQDILSFRLVAPWHAEYIESWLKREYVKELVCWGLELKCPESLIGLESEERSEPSHYVKGNGISLTHEDLATFKSKVDWNSFVNIYEPQRRAVITSETNAYLLPGALTITKPLHLSSNVAADDKNVQDHWYHGQPVYILGATNDQQWLYLMAGIDTSGWVHRRHVSFVTDDVIKTFTANMVMTKCCVSGVSEKFGSEIKLQRTSLLSRQGEHAPFTYVTVVQHVCISERDKHPFKIFPAQIDSVTLEDSTFCPVTDDALVLIEDHPRTRDFFFERLFAVMQGIEFSWGGGCREDAVVPACDTSKFVQTVCRDCMAVDIPRNSQGIIEQVKGGDLFDLPYGMALIRSYEHEGTLIIASAAAYGSEPVTNYVINLPGERKQAIGLCHSKLPTVIGSTDQNILHRQYVVELIRELGTTGDIFGGPGGKIFVYLGSTTINDIRLLAEEKMTDVDRVSIFFPDEDGSQSVLLMSGCPLGGWAPDRKAWDITGRAHIFGITPASPVVNVWLDSKIHVVNVLKESWLEKLWTKKKGHSSDAG